MKVATLYIHPIKGCRASSVESADFNHEGLAGDRAFMVINQEGVHVSQKHCPRLATLVPTITSDGLTITAEDGEIFHHSLQIGRTIPARIHRTSLAAQDQGNEVAEWFSRKLKLACRLVAAPKGYQRNAPYPSLGDIHGQRLSLFNDLAPVLLTTQASLDDLNSRLETSIPITRFRPNIVLEDTLPWEEDDIVAISRDSLVLERRAPCERCVIITTDQVTGERGPEPYQALVQFRNKEKVISSGIWFGAYMAVTGGGRLKVGDELHRIRVQ